MGLFDFNKVLNLVENDKGMAVTLSTMFVEQAKEDQQKLLNALESNDIVAVGKHAHKMKSSLSTLGMMETSDLLKSIEHAAKNNENVDDIKIKISKAVEDLEIIYTEINNAIA